MPEVNLTVEVHCQQPQWVFQDHNKKYATPIYRIYVNGDLLTERTWIWAADQTYIKEDMWVNLVRNVDYTILLDPMLLNPAQSKFTLMNFTSKNSTYTQQRISNNEISFKLQ